MVLVSPGAAAWGGGASVREAAGEFQLGRGSVLMYKLSLLSGIVPASENVFDENKVSCLICTTSSGTSTQFIGQIAQFQL